MLSTEQAPRVGSGVQERCNAGIDYSKADEATKTELKVIADHTRAVTYLISDGVVPSNLGRGYVVRRLLRRVVLKGRLLGVKKPFVAEVAKVAIDMSGDCDPDVRICCNRSVGGFVSRICSCSRPHCLWPAVGLCVKAACSA
jgi:alanyl-tRNA synthetase